MKKKKKNESVGLFFAKTSKKGTNTVLQSRYRNEVPTAFTLNSTSLESQSLCI